MVGTVRRVGRGVVEETKEREDVREAEAGREWE